MFLVLLFLQIELQFTLKKSMGMADALLLFYRNLLLSQYNIKNINYKLVYWRIQVALHLLIHLRLTFASILRAPRLLVRDRLSRQQK